MIWIVKWECSKIKGLFTTTKYQSVNENQGWNAVENMLKLGGNLDGICRLKSSWNPWEFWLESKLKCMWKMIRKWEIGKQIGIPKWYLTPQSNTPWQNPFSMITLTNNFLYSFNCIRLYKHISRITWQGIAKNIRKYTKIKFVKWF